MFHLGYLTDGPRYCDSRGGCTKFASDKNTVWQKRCQSPSGALLLTLNHFRSFQRIRKYMYICHDYCNVRIIVIYCIPYMPHRMSKWSQLFRTFCARKHCALIPAGTGRHGAPRRVLGATLYNFLVTPYLPSHDWSSQPCLCLPSHPEKHRHTFQKHPNPNVHWKFHQFAPSARSIQIPFTTNFFRKLDNQWPQPDG